MSSSSLMMAACECMARRVLRLSCSRVWLTTPMRTSISCSSSDSFLIAPLIRTTGVASEMLLPFSSISVFISSSCSLIRCRSLLRSLMASVRLLYPSWISCSCCREARYCCISRSNCSLRKRSRVVSFSRLLFRSPRSFSSTVRFSGQAVEMVLLWLCTSSRWLRQSLASAFSRILSFGVTRSSSSFHSVGSTLLCSMAFSAASGPAAAPAAPKAPSAVGGANPAGAMYASSSSCSSAYWGMGNSSAPAPSAAAMSGSSSTSASSTYPSGR
mmetsp:Transcript_14908/g.32321  ORF Transcript_14908/g.32321 Transcript_14908/m.32321 type:complete len:271 (+) Transcript_14908:731-1543(+)